MNKPKVSLDGKGIITLETDGLPPSQIARLHRLLHKIVTHGVLSIDSGVMTVHFDDQGEIATIEVMKRWRNLNKAEVTPL